MSNFFNRLLLFAFLLIFGGREEFFNMPGAERPAYFYFFSSINAALEETMCSSGGPERIRKQEPMQTLAIEFWTRAPSQAAAPSRSRFDPHTTNRRPLIVQINLFAPNFREGVDLKKHN